MAGFEELEDDIELPELEIIQVEQPRKFSRLKKGGINENRNINAIKGIDTPENDVRGTLEKSMLADEENDEENSDPEASEGAGGDENAAHGGKEEEQQTGEEEEGDVEIELDEEDEEAALEQYFKERSENGVADDSDSSESDSEDEDYSAPKPLGANPSLEDLNAETQRILRETAARDRLGKGQKIEIKPLTGIIAKLKERRALAIARAPKAQAMPGLLSFDDMLVNMEAEQGPAQAENPAAEGEENVDNVDNKDAVPAGDEDLDFEIVSDAEDEDVAEKIVELPTAQKPESKPSPLEFNPYNHSMDFDEFEDEPLIDDGLGSDDESDSESERSWEVKQDGKEAEEDKEGEVDQEKEIEEESEEADGSEEMEVDAAEAADAEKVAAGRNDGAAVEAPEGDANKPSAIAVLLAASEKVPEKIKKGQRKYLDTEAELSDEEGAAVAVSDDEDEDNLDDNGELADLITDEKSKLKDLRATEEYHVQWARQQDAKDLQQVLRGLENGFRRRRLGGLDDAEDELHGRWRRARFDGDDFEGLPGAFAFPSGFQGQGGDDEEECEDEIMLNKAREHRLLVGSEGINHGSGGAAIALDEDSQAVLGMLARSASGSQQQHAPAGLGGGTGSGDAPAAAGNAGGGASRFGLEFRATDRAAFLRGSSFIGRQSTAVRTQSGSGALGLGSGTRSFVFGRSENSNSALALEGGLGKASQTQSEEPTGPVNFANLRQMAGLPAGNAAGSGGGAAAGSSRNKKRKKAAPSLVSRLKNQGNCSAFGSQDSLNAVAAVCQNIAMGPAAANKRRRS